MLPKANRFILLFFCIASCSSILGQVIRDKKSKPAGSALLQVGARVQSATASCPPNIDFESGNFSNWESNTGSIYTPLTFNVNPLREGGSYNFIIQDNATWNINAGISGRHQLIDRNSSPPNDPYGGFPVNPPFGGGRYALKLGTDEPEIDPYTPIPLPLSLTESVRYKIKVPPAPASEDFSIVFAYAVVFEDPKNQEHAFFDRPSFRAYLYNPVTRDTIDCLNLTFVATSNIPGFKTSTVKNPFSTDPNYSDIKYKEWTPVFVNLSKYPDQELYVEFTSTDCTLLGHFGYAYVDVIECNYKIKATGSCSPTSTTTLEGPEGPFQFYEWRSADFQTVYGTGKNLVLNQALPPNSQVKLIVTPYSGLGCRDTLTATVQGAGGPALNLGLDKTVCGTQSTQIGVPPVSGYTYQWSPATSLSSANQSIVTANPSVTTTYTLTVTDPATGCRASDDIRISVSTPINLTVNSGTICPGQPLQLTASGANAYSWSPATGLSSTSGAVVTANPSSTTSYTVTGTNTTTNCQATATATVTVQPSVAITGRSVSPVGCVSTNGTIILSGLSPNTNYTVNYDRNSVAQSSQTLTSAANGEISIGGLGTGTYSNIRVTINGCGSNTVGPFTINSPVPDKPVLSSQQITLCEGVATGAISFTAASGAIIRWTNSVPAIGLAANGTGNIASFNTVNNTGTTLQADVKVVADLNGCISAEETLRITVYPKVLLTVNSPTICPGTSVQLIASGANSYTWSPAAGLSSTTGASVNATPAATTTYTVTGTNTATNCQVSANATVTVQPLVAIAGRFISPVGCIGTGGIIILSGLNPNTTYTVNYERNSVSQNPQTLTSGVNGEISIGGLGTGTYTNIRVASNGCLSNAVGPYTFTSPVPDKPVLSAQQLTFCEGAATGNISFTTASGTIVRWTNSIPAIGLAANGTGDIVSFNTVNNTGTTLQAEIKVAAEQNGCRSIEEVLRITVYPKIMLNVNPASICPGASVQLTASGANNYTWSPAVGLNSTTGSVVTANPVATTTYTITGTNTATNCQAIAQTTVIVLPLPDPLLSVSGNSPNICEGSFVLLTANGGVNYQWYLNNQPISGATNSSYQATQPGSYSVEATNTQGCKNFSANKPVLQLLKKPKASFSVQAVCLGRPLLVTDLSVTNQSGPVSYLWDLGDGSSSTNSLPLHTYNKGGFFTVKLKVFSLNCPNLIDSFSSLVLVDTPRAGIRYPTISTLINTNTNLKARNFGTSYLWQPSQGLSRVNVFNPVFNYDKETDYLIRIGTPSGCITYDSVLVRVFSNSDVLVPTGFTPNRDGVNDFLDVYTIGIRKIHFWVFNRWGQLMFETTDPAQRWDGNFQGKPQPLENYVWIVEAESVSGQIIRKRGQTILIR